MKKTERQMYVCLSCGSIHVQQKVWADLNSSSIDWDGSSDLDEYYCEDSKHRTTPVLRTIKTVNGAVRVEGYQVRDVAGDIHPAMSNNKSLYSLEQANEMLLDDTPGYWYLKAVYRHDFEGQVKMFTGKPRL